MTDDEIDKLCPETWSDWKTSARAIIAAHTEKLLAGVEMPEPCIYEGDDCPMYHAPKGYTIDQLQSYAAAAALNARVKALEEAATELEGLYSLGGDDIAKCLRQMKGNV